MRIQRVVELLQLSPNHVQRLRTQRLTVVVGHQTVHGVGQLLGCQAHAHKRLLLAVYLRHVQIQAEFMDRRLGRVLSQRGLRVINEAQHRGLTGHTRRQHHAPGNDTRHKAESRRVLLHVAGAPGGVAGTQGHAQLRVMRAGKLVQLTGPCHFVAHFGELGRATQSIGKGLHLHHKFRVLNIVQRAAAVGQLHAGLHELVALASEGHFPRLRCLIETLNGKGFAAHATRSRHGG